MLKWCSLFDPTYPKMHYVPTGSAKLLMLVLFCLFYKPTKNEVFDDFPKISDHFPKIFEDFENLSGSHTNVSEHFSKFSENFRRFPKIAEDCRGRSEDVST